MTPDLKRDMLFQVRRVKVTSKGTNMKMLTATTVAAGALVWAAVGFAQPAAAAPSAPVAVADTVRSLQSDGYTVILNRTGARPLSQCAVSGVRGGQTFSHTDSGNPGDVLATTIISKTVYVDVTC